MTTANAGNQAAGQTELSLDDERVRLLYRLSRAGYVGTVLAALLVGVAAHDVLPQASTIATLGVHGFHQGRVVCAEDAQPVYLRDKVAQTEIERKNAKLNAENTR